MGISRRTIVKFAGMVLGYALVVLLTPLRKVKSLLKRQKQMLKKSTLLLRQRSHWSKRLRVSLALSLQARRHERRQENRGLIWPVFPPLADVAV